MRDIGMQPGYYTGLGQVIDRFTGWVYTAVSAAMGVVHAFTLYEKMQLSVNDPEEYKKRYPGEVENA